MTFEVPAPDLQITFFNRLQEMRERVLLDGLLAFVAAADVSEIDRELSQFVSLAALQRVASLGLRGEVLFATPYVLTGRPQLVGYYRLLLGFSQKQFYGPLGFLLFRSMEEKARLSGRQQALIPDFCRVLCRSAELLLDGVTPISKDMVHELTLLTLGPQLRGGALNLFGARATSVVFNIIKMILGTAVKNESSSTLAVRNAAGREVVVAFASDPDIVIQERLASGQFHNLVAIEIKGGKDGSNIHNRIGEAEKSHQKARQLGFVECWTIVGIRNLNLSLARRESPSTDRFYHLAEVARAGSVEFNDFRDQLRSRAGVSD